MFPSIRCAASRLRHRPLAYLIAAALPAMIASPAFAMSFNVDTLNDTISGNATHGSLRDGLIAVNASTDPTNTIQFQAALTGTITLTSPLPMVFNNVTIDGTGASIAIDGGLTYRIFFVGVDATTAASLHTAFPSAPLGNPLQVAFTNLTLENGRAKGGDGGGGGMGAGGALFVNGNATVTLNDVSFFNNQAIGGNGTANSSSGSHTFAGGGGLGGNGGKSSGNAAGGGGIFGNGANSITGPAGGGIFGNAGYGPGGGGGYYGNGGSYAGPGGAGRALAGITGSGGSGYHGAAAGGANGGGGGGGANSFAGGGGGFGGGNASGSTPGSGGFGGGGGGANSGGTVGGNGGFGGGGGFGPGGAGAGGFGGGGAVGTGTGGAGGFGAGGGDGSNGGGAGGFGGGGGGSRVSAGTGGTAGFGGGNGSAAGGGGGAGLGGAVFVVKGGALNINGGSMTESGGIAAGGTTPAAGAIAGSSSGGGFFLAGSGTLKFAPNAGALQHVQDALADESHAVITPPSGFVTGAWGLQKDGLGIVQIDAVNGYSGPTTVNAGVLRNSAQTSSVVTVAAGATLGGSGSFFSLASAGTLVPGSSTNPQGALTLATSATMQPSSLTCFHIASTGLNSSSSIVSASATVNGPVRLDFSAQPAVNDSFILVNTTGGVSGTFTGFATNNPHVDGILGYSPNLVIFAVTATDGIFRDQFEGGNDEAPCAAGFGP